MGWFCVTCCRSEEKALSKVGELRGCVSDYTVSQTSLEDSECIKTESRLLLVQSQPANTTV
eukprot:3147938-Amphidinium_carterae.1